MTDDVRPRPAETTAKLGDRARAWLPPRSCSTPRFTHRWLANSQQAPRVRLWPAHELRVRRHRSTAPGTQVRERTRTRSVVAQMARARATITHQKLTSSAFVPAGWVTLSSVLLRAAGVLAAAACALARVKKPDLPIAPTTIALLGVMVGADHRLRVRRDEAGSDRHGRRRASASGCSAPAVVMGIVGAQMMAKVNRPPDPEWTADSMSPRRVHDLGSAHVPARKDAVHHRREPRHRPRDRPARRARRRERRRSPRRRPSRTRSCRARSTRRPRRSRRPAARRCRCIVRHPRSRSRSPPRSRRRSRRSAASTSS